MTENTFAPSGKRTLVGAFTWARRLCHSCLGWEHILLGAAALRGGAGERVLWSEGIDLCKIACVLEEQMGRGKTPCRDVFLGEDALGVIEGAVFKAEGRGVCDVHLLLALLEKQSGALELLRLCGADTVKICNRLSEYDTCAAKTEKALKLTLEYGTDMTQKAKSGEYDAVFGRENELARTVNILSRRRKSNPLLLGEPGVGKTAVAEALAQSISLGNVPVCLKNTRLISIDMASVVAGTKYRGEFEEKLKKIILEVKNAGNVILFIDEIHTLCGAGAAEGAIDGANILKPALARGEIRLIGATTQGEYRKYICRDGALERRFQPVEIGEPTALQTEEILRGLKSTYEQYHGVELPASLLAEAVALTQKHIPHRCLPDKAIDLCDEALAAAALKGQKVLCEAVLLESLFAMASTEKAGKIGF